MAREQTHERASSGGTTSRRGYLRLSGVAALGAFGAAVGNRADRQTRIDGDSPENTLAIVGSASAPTTYEVTVSDEIVPGRHADALSVVGSTGQSAEDAITDGIRSYRFNGKITNIRVDGDAAVFLNGAKVNPELLG